MGLRHFETKSYLLSSFSPSLSSCLLLPSLTCCLSSFVGVAVRGFLPLCRSSRQSDSYEHQKVLLEDTDTVELLQEAVTSFARARVPVRSHEGIDERQIDSSNEAGWWNPWHCDRMCAQKIGWQDLGTAVHEAVRVRMRSISVPSQQELAPTVWGIFCELPQTRTPKRRS